MVLAGDGSLLLVRLEFPDASVWVLPGGGIEPGESTAEALRRELSEEVGLNEPTIGLQVWERTHIVPFVDGSHDGQHDRFFLVQVAERFEPQPGLDWVRLRAEYVHELRWWTPEEITASDARFAPRRLAVHLAHLVDSGPPAEPIDVGV